MKKLKKKLLEVGRTVLKILSIGVDGDNGLQTNRQTDRQTGE